MAAESPFVKREPVVLELERFGARFGVVVVSPFAAKPRDHSKKVNKKMYHGAMQAILSELVRQDRLIVVEDFAIEAPKTKAFSAKLKELELTNVLVVVEEVDDNLYLGCRNIHNVDVIDVQGVNPVNLIGFKKVLFTVGALKKAEELFA